jgi:mono/diheme cytochrome c family protein
MTIESPPDGARIYNTGWCAADRIRRVSEKERGAMRSYLAYRGTSKVVGGVMALAAMALLGCASVPRGATAEELARAHDQTAQGATVYANECASCHGQRGEGLASAPAILGPGALPEYPRDTSGVGDPTITDPQLIQIQAQTRPAGAPWRDPLRNADDLRRFTGTHVPKSRADKISESDYWAVVGFVLAAQGVTLPAGGLNASNAASIPIPKR